MMHKAIASKDSIQKIKYIWYKFFDFDPTIIFEFGARYCEDSIYLAEVFSLSKIFSFECNPTALEHAKLNIKNNQRIKLFEKAVGNYDGKTEFYPINKEKTITTWEDGNQGASSLFRASGKYPIEQYAQDEIEVDICKATTIMKSSNISDVDILWMDIQGAELLALEGFEENLSRVKFIHTEVEFFEIYEAQPLFKELKSFLTRRNFYFWGYTNKGDFSADAVFINFNLIKAKLSFFEKIKHYSSLYFK